jgi:uncharacterized surface protein with fasciclin (FAS1) repeats
MTMMMMTIVKKKKKLRLGLSLTLLLRLLLAAASTSAAAPPSRLLRRAMPASTTTTTTISAVYRQLRSASYNYATESSSADSDHYAPFADAGGNTVDDDDDDDSRTITTDHRRVEPEAALTAAGVAAQQQQRQLQLVETPSSLDLITVWLDQFNGTDSAESSSSSSSDFPSVVPSDAPTLVPSDAPSLVPSDAPSLVPSDAPSLVPSDAPSLVPSRAPSPAADDEEGEQARRGRRYRRNLQQQKQQDVGDEPVTVWLGQLNATTTSDATITLLPSDFPSLVPSDAPSLVPSDAPSFVPSDAPSLVPSDAPSLVPSDAPSLVPSERPSTLLTTSSRFSFFTFMTSSWNTNATNTTTTTTTMPQRRNLQSGAHDNKNTTATAPALVIDWLGRLQNNSTNNTIATISSNSDPATLPSDFPSLVPTPAPSAVPLSSSSDVPSMLPSDVPSLLPSDVPSTVPSDAPSLFPSDAPSLAPTMTFAGLNQRDGGGGGSVITVLDLVEKDARLNWFRIMLEKGGLDDVVALEPDLTVLAPTNGAFQALDRNYFAKLLRAEYELHVTALVRNHLLRGRRVSMADLRPGQTWVTSTAYPAGTVRAVLNPVTGNVDITSGGDDEGDGLTSNTNAQIIDWDVKASNGIVHIIDQVLLPSFVTMDALTQLERGEFNPDLSSSNGNNNTVVSHASFLRLVTATPDFAETLRTLDDATLFLPTDDAFRLNCSLFYLMTTTPTPPNIDDNFSPTMSCHLSSISNNSCCARRPFTIRHWTGNGFRSSVASGLSSTGRRRWVGA